METQVLTKIDTYSLSDVSFTKREVLSSATEIQIRSDELRRGLTLGNIYKEISKLRFESADGEPMETEGSI